MEFEIKQTPEDVSENPKSRSKLVIVLIIVGMLIAAWFTFSIIRRVFFPSNFRISQSLTTSLKPDKIFSAVGFVLSVSPDNLIINAPAEVNFSEKDRLIRVFLSKKTKYLNQVTSSSEIVESSWKEVIAGDQVIVQGDGNIKDKTEINAESITIIVY